MEPSDSSDCLQGQLFVRFVICVFNVEMQIFWSGVS